MNSKELQDKYNNLTAKLKNAEMEKVKLSTQLETITAQHKNIEKQILEAAGTPTVEEAVKSLEQLEKVIAEQVAEAEKLLLETV